MTELVYMLIDNPEFTEKNRILWLMESFKFALKTEKMEIAVNLWETYKETFDRNSSDLINAILACLGKSSAHFELKYYILSNFLANFEYKQIDRLISTIEYFLMTIEPIESYLATNLNPIKTSVLLMDLVLKIYESYAITEFRVNSIKDFLMKSLRYILINLYYPIEIKMQVRQKDIFETDAMSYMERMDAYTLMDTKIMDRIMKELWNSDIDVSGTILEQSTCNKILKDADDEMSQRFYSKRSLEKTRPHILTMRVWMESIKFRYWIEIIFFLSIAVAF